MTQLDPRVSEFDTQAQADDYNAWFCAKVQAAIDSPHLALTHDAAMARVEQALAERRKARAAA